MRPNQSANSLGPRHTFHMCKVSRAWNWPLTWSYTVELHLDLHMCLTCLVAWLSTRSTLNFNSYWFSHCTLNIPHNLKMCTALKWYCPAFGWQLLPTVHMISVKEGSKFHQNSAHNILFDGRLKSFQSTTGCLYQSTTVLQPWWVRECALIPTSARHSFFLFSNLSRPPLE